MRNVVIGTAGHVDHGKTCLIKALTGMDTDRLVEEKKRGITIENGFAELIYREYNISIIDVPGHERFVKNMLAGIGGIDMVLLVIGLDEGVRPQTTEHLEILKMLHIDKGIIVFTKNDLVDDEEWKALVEEETKGLVKGSFLEGAPTIRVSAHTGENIEALKELIIEQQDEGKEKIIDQTMLRLPVDRVFTIDGFGTVVTGTLLEGQVSRGDEIVVYPEQTLIKVRNVQVHNEDVEAAFAGQRTAINLTNVKKESINRGDVIAAKGSLNNTLMVDVKLELFEDTKRAVLNHSRVHLYCGSAETLCKVVLMDQEELGPGETGYAQLRLEREIAVRKGDRFIVRFYSPVESIGGGVILDANPKKHKRNVPEVIRQMVIKDQGTLTENIELAIHELSQEMVDCTAIAMKLCCRIEETKAVVQTLREQERIFELQTGALIHMAFFENVKAASQDILGKYHEVNKMSKGMAREEFKSRLQGKCYIDDSKQVEALMQLLNHEGVAEIGNNVVKLVGFQVTYSAEMEDLRRRMLNKYVAQGFEMPKVDELLELEKDKKNAKHMIDILAEDGDIVKLSFQYYIDRNSYDEAKNIIQRKVDEHGQITLAEFRDALGTSRKYAVELLEHFDQIKYTKKVDDARILA
ncbi:selenocysteine-specific elongation factor [Clostridiales Family XIII bacterium PM5-7]